MKIKYIVLCAISVAWLVGCHSADSAKTKTSVILVKKAPMSKELYYSGSVKPLQTTVVVSPDDGLIETLNFNYGDKVNEKQLLFMIHSDQFQQNFASIVTKYITAKNQFAESASKLANTRDLFKDGLVSHDDFQSDQDTYYNNNIALLQAKKNLVDLLHRHKEIKLDVHALELSNTKELKKLLSINTTQGLLKVYAPTTGIALLPDKNTISGGAGAAGSTNTVVEKGSAVKKDQVVLSIGNLSGAEMDVDVNEVDINQIKPGLQAIITSVAFPGIVLHGKVVSVGSQAGTGGSEGVPTFPVKIIVSALESLQQQVIRVGMSVKVQITIQYPPAITIPLAAVIQEKGGTFVRMQQANGTFKSVPVVTGKTGLDTVVITQGLKVGDHIAVTH